MSEQSAESELLRGPTFSDLVKDTLDSEFPKDPSFSDLQPQDPEFSDYASLTQPSEDFERYVPHFPYASMFTLFANLFFIFF